jgi:uncharacterized repeat protein (TIGR01451 family)
MNHSRTSSRLRRLFVAVMLAVVSLLGVVVALVLAQIELPPAGSVAFIQTSGPMAGLNIGDWYTDAAQGNRPHNFKIFVPCTVPPAQIFTVELFDPEVFTGTQVVDEIRGLAADDTTFELRAPDNSVIASTTYPSTAATNDQFVTFATFTTNAWGCGTYTLLASTGTDDDNGWRLRLSPDDLDGSPGSGDELLLATFEASFQHTVSGCQVFPFFVPVTPSLHLNNFDLDFPNLSASVTYTPPGGGSLPGTTSGPTVWNNSADANRVGDVIANPTPGWWQAQICGDPDNQYIFEPEGLTHFFAQPPIPEMTVSKDDGLTEVAAGQFITYTISYANNGQGAALDAVLTETLPASTTFVACSGGLSCGEVLPPGSGVVTCDLGNGLAGMGGQVNLTIQVGNTVPPSTTLTNLAQLDYTDTMNNDYPPQEVTDSDHVAAPTPTPTPTPTSTPKPPPDHDRAPTPTLTPTPTVVSSGLTYTPTITPPDVLSTTLPVSFLPETGLRAYPGVSTALFWLAVIGFSAVILFFWTKLK